MLGAGCEAIPGRRSANDKTETNPTRRAFDVGEFCDFSEPTDLLCFRRKVADAVDLGKLIAGDVSSGTLIDFIPGLRLLIFFVSSARVQTLSCALSVLIETKSEIVYMNTII